MGWVEDVLGRTGRMATGGVASLADMARPVSDPVYTGLGYLAKGTGFPDTANYLFGAANAPTASEIAQQYYDLKTSGKYKPRNTYELIIDAIGQMGVGAMTPMGLAKGYSALDKTGIWADEIGSIGGIKAKTADKQKLALAQKMDESGELPAKIWNETGWFKGHDNQWRFEIPDENAKFIGEIDTSGKMKQYLDHPELYAAYPDLADIKARYARYIESSFQPYHGVSIGNTGNPAKTAVHEANHGIQYREGFNYGAQPESVVRPDKDAFYKLGEGIHDDIRSLSPEIQKDIERALKEKSITSQWYNTKFHPNDRAVTFVERLRDYAGNNNIPEIENKAAAWLKLYQKPGNSADDYKRGVDDAFIKYLQNKAELEARTVEHRLNYGPEQRRRIPFMEDYNYYNDLAKEGKAYE